MVTESLLNFREDTILNRTPQQGFSKLGAKYCLYKQAFLGLGDLASISELKRRPRDTD